MSPLLLAPMITQILWNPRHRLPGKIGQGTLFRETMRPLMQEEQQDSLHRQAMSGRATTSGTPERSVYHLFRTIKSMNRKSGHRGESGRWNCAPASIITEGLGETSTLSTDSLHRVLRVGGATMDQQAVHQTGHIIVPKARSVTLVNGRINDHRTRVATQLDGHPNDHKVRRVIPGDNGQGNPTAIETLRLAGPPIGARLRHSRRTKQGSYNRTKLSTLLYAKQDS